MARISGLSYGGHSLASRYGYGRRRISIMTDTNPICLEVMRDLGMCRQSTLRCKSTSNKWLWEVDSIDDAKALISLIREVGAEAQIL